MQKPVIAITMGDPCGVGPEIIVKALSDPLVRLLCTPVVLGDAGAMERAVSLCSTELEIIPLPSPGNAKGLPDSTIPLICISELPPSDICFGKPTELSGDAVYRYIRRAAGLCLTGEVSAMATAPISKEAMHRAGHNYPGHTELLAELCRCENYVMMLAGDILRVSLVTIHEAISDVPRLITTDNVLRTIRVTAKGVTPLCGNRKPRIAVLSLNPHCGEGGMFGNEEKTAIVPAISMARAEGLDVNGPFSADTFFHFAVQEIGRASCRERV